MGDGEAAGEEKSKGGLVTRAGIPFVVALNADLEVSSSECGISTSLSNDDKNDGSPLVSLKGLDGGEARRCRFGGRLGPATVGEADDDSTLSMTRLVRGRFNFRSGSVGGSAGEAVTDLDFRFLFLGLVVSSSFAFSKAPQALDSSGSS